MKIKLLYLISFSVSFLTFAQSSQQSFIVGGRDALADEFPWMVELIVDNGHHCGGALINANWVITAAHCVKAVPAFGVGEPDRVLINNIQRAQTHSNSENINIAVNHHHELFTFGGSLPSDIALVKLSSPSSITPIPINDTDPNIVSVDDTVYTLGWGITTPGGQLLNKLKIAQPLVKNISPGIIEAGFDIGEDEQGAAAGDSGGPLVVKTDDGYKLIGCVSGGAGQTTTAGSPGEFTRIFAYADWIDSVMNFQPVGLNEGLNNSIKIFQEKPNELTVFNSNEFDEIMEFTIINISGQTIYKGQIDGNIKIQNIDISKLNIGAYFLRINDRPSSSYKFLKRQ